MSNVLLFPGCACSPGDIEAREQETGLIAVRACGSAVIRMVSACSLPSFQAGRAADVSGGPELPGVF